MTIKEAIKTYAYLKDVMYDIEYLQINDCLIRADCFNTQHNDNELTHTITGELLEEPVNGIVFFNNDNRVIAIVHEKCHAELDWFDAFCDDEWEV